MGRVGADLYPDQIKTPLSEVRSFTRFVGGFAGNVGTGLARLGVRTAIVSRVGDDGHGEFVRAFLAAEGLDVRFLRTDPDWPTPITFCEVWPPDRFPLLFYRRPTAPDWQLAPGDFGADEIAAATLAALRAHRGTTIFDLDWRPALWERPADYPPLAAEAVAAADLVIGNEEELEAAGTPDVRPLVLKRGGRGTTVRERAGDTDVPATRVEVLNGLGAGDAFAAALGWALLHGRTLVDAVRLGSVAGSIVAGRLACSAAMPTLEELPV
jgi:5-dehydro-2-deoxygluconokinase